MSKCYVNYIMSTCATCRPCLSPRFKMLALTFPNSTTSWNFITDQKPFFAAAPLKTLVNTEIVIFVIFVNNNYTYVTKFAFMRRHTLHNCPSLLISKSFLFIKSHHSYKKTPSPSCQISGIYGEGVHFCSVILRSSLLQALLVQRALPQEQVPQPSLFCRDAAELQPAAPECRRLRSQTSGIPYGHDPHWSR